MLACSTSYTVDGSVRELREPLPQSIVNSIRPLYEIGSAQFAAVSADLQELNAHRYARQISGGCQEYIEAASFQHYLTTGSLMSYEEAASGMKASDPQGPGVTLSPEDYLLGIYDMTGELMKYAITTMATTGSLPSTGGTGDSRNILADMRGLRLALESLDTGSGPFAREVEKKMNVMQASVEKVERALYGLTVRGAERPKGWMPDTSDSGRVIEVEG